MEVGWRGTSGGSRSGQPRHEVFLVRCGKVAGIAREVAGIARVERPDGWPKVGPSREGKAGAQVGLPAMKMGDGGACPRGNGRWEDREDDSCGGEVRDG